MKNKVADPVIRQTENGPMMEIREKAPWGWYAAGAAALVYACIFPMYRLFHFILFAAVITAVGVLVQRRTPEKTRLVPYTKPFSATGNSVVDEILQQGQKVLEELRTANRALPDAQLTAQIDQIDAACVRIFEYIRQNPEQAGQIRKFMNYYLPTLLQLLKIRAQLEEQGATGENISASKQRIAGMLQQAAGAFDTFYDQLHADQAMNINAEISVFESMLQQEGLLRRGM